MNAGEANVMERDNAPVKVVGAVGTATASSRAVAVAEAIFSGPALEKVTRLSLLVHEMAGIVELAAGEANAPTRSEPDTIAPTRPKPLVQSKVMAWLDRWVADRMARGESGSQDSAWRAAKNEFGHAARRKPILARYRKIAPSEWQKQGRRPKPN